MGRIEKTVFISYRRANRPWALNIYQELTHRGYDVFFDYLSIPSGDFEKIIVENIKGRAHFIIMLTPSALERCNEPGDWLRREIETAMDEKRNIVPLMLESFDFKSPSTTNALTGKLAKLNKYNALSVPSEYFFEAMERLQEKFLNVPLDAVIHPISSNAKQIAEKHQVAANAAKPIEQKELTAQEWFEKGYKSTNPYEQIYFYTEAIRLKPDYADAYYNRGGAHQDKGDLDGAIKDYNEAIRLQPDGAFVYNNRGIALKDQGDLEGSIKDYDKAIHLKPDYADAYYNRGSARQDKGDLDGAIKDYNEAIRLQPDDAVAYNNRGVACQNKGDLERAVKDYNNAIQIKPDYWLAHFNLEIARWKLVIARLRKN